MSEKDDKKNFLMAPIERFLVTVTFSAFFFIKFEISERNFAIPVSQFSSASPPCDLLIFVVTKERKDERKENREEGEKKKDPDATRKRNTKSIQRQGADEREAHGISRPCEICRNESSNHADDYENDESA